MNEGPNVESAAHSVCAECSTTAERRRWRRRIRSIVSCVGVRENDVTAWCTSWPLIIEPGNDARRSSSVTTNYWKKSAGAVRVSCIGRVRKILTAS